MCVYRGVRWLTRPVWCRSLPCWTRGGGRKVRMLQQRIWWRYCSRAYMFAIWTCGVSPQCWRSTNKLINYQLFPKSPMTSVVKTLWLNYMALFRRCLDHWMYVKFSSIFGFTPTLETYDNNSYGYLEFRTRARLKQVYKNVLSLWNVLKK